MRSAVLLFVAGLAACSVPSIEEQETLAPSSNTCARDVDCGEENTCQSVGPAEDRRSICVTSESQFDTVLLTVTPPATTESVDQQVAGVRFVQSRSGLAVPSAFDLRFPRPTRIVATFDASEALRAGCEAPMGDAVVTFTPAERIVGLPLKSYSGDVRFAGARVSDGLALGLPAGEYDVYFLPSTMPEDPCSMPPQLVEGVEIPEAGEPRPVAFQLAEPERLSVTLVWPAAAEQTLEGWVVDVVDDATGRSLSQPHRLGAPTPPPDGRLTETDEPAVEHRVEVEFASEVIGRGGASVGLGKELVRLRPPDGETAPTLVWKREGLEVLTPGVVTEDLSELAAGNVVVRGVVELLETAVAVPATLTFVAEELEGVIDAATYSVSMETEVDGTFEVPLLPGTYRVRAIPSAEAELDDAQLAATEITGWSVAAEPAFQAGKLIMLQQSRSIRGTVLESTPGAEPIVGATVQAVASPGALSLNAFQVGQGKKPFTPRAGSAVTDGAGVFAFVADPGVYDVSVRLAEDSDFPWLVRPNERFTGEENRRLDLSVSLPVVHAGRVFVGSMTDATGLANAIVRAYVYVQGDGLVTEAAAPGPGQPGLGVLQVAESRTRDDGSFDLLLPAALN